MDSYNYSVHMHLRQGSHLYRIDDHSTDHYLVLLFRHEVSGSGGILPGDDHGDERCSHFNASSFVDLYYQTKVHQREEQGLSSGGERNPSLRTTRDLRVKKKIRRNTFLLTGERGWIEIIER